MIYAKRYGYVLDSGDARDILALKDDDRNRAMKALALLSKHEGKYDQWKAIRNKHDLKWAGESSIEIFNRIVNNSEASYSEMLEWVKKTIKGLPPSYGNVIRFAASTGMRASESLLSIKLIKTDLDHYLKNGILEHFRFPCFIRRTKKAFISIATDEIIDLARSCQDVNYEGFRAYLKRRNYKTHLGYCRKLFATHLRMNGIEQELVSIFQGRVEKTIFSQYYFRPDFDKEQERIRTCLSKLHKELSHHSN